MLGQILVYSMPGCPHCTSAKMSLNKLNLPYIEIQLDLYDKSVREELKKLTNRSTGMSLTVLDSQWTREQIASV